MAKVFSNRVLGVIFIGLLAFGVWIVNGVFTQKFVSFDKVTLSTTTTTRSINRGARNSRADP